MKKIQITLVALAGLLFSACTKLDERLRSETSSGSSGGGVGNPTALLQGAYGALNNPFEDQTRWWACQEHTSDECVGPTRGGDWDDNGIWRVYHNHRWTSEHDFLTATYRELAQAQFAATTVLDASPSPQQAAEARFIRALAMWAVLDGWDQVPFRSTSLGDLTQSLPEVKKGTTAADFIIAELNAAMPNLPNGAGIGIASKDAARALLMKLYLNRGVYANRTAPTFAPADMNQVITLADQILAGPYNLGTNFFDNFAPTNNAIGTELVYTLKCDNAAGFGGNNQSRWFCGLHYNQNPSGWNGFTTLGDFYDKFDAADKRRGGTYTGLTNVTGLRTGLLFGQQFNQSGTALQDRKGNPLSFTKAVALKETGNNLEVTGIRVIKYVPDLAHQFPADNDYVMFRLADILLMKAEAIARGGTGTNVAPYGNTAASIVNYIRTHSTRGVAALGTVDLNAIYDERGREFYWEGWRRNDMIRFGKFLAAKQLKPDVSGNERLLFPIPNEQLVINPNLTQNPGY
jgi:hypothetical protein